MVVGTATVSMTVIGGFVMVWVEGEGVEATVEARPGEMGVIVFKATPKSTPMRMPTNRRAPVSPTLHSPFPTLLLYQPHSELGLSLIYVKKKTGKSNRATRESLAEEVIERVNCEVD